MTDNYFIPLSVPNIIGNEWKYVKECLDTGWISSAGKYVNTFEKKIAEFTGSKYAVACVNGTAALHIALLLIGVESGDEVIVPTITFIAPINAVKYCGANPIFMDSDDYFNIDTEKTLEFILNKTKFINGQTVNTFTGKVIKAIVPVHVFGNAVNFDSLYEICVERNIKIVEDASESLGTVYKNSMYRNVHTGTIGEVGIISFNGNKIISTGGGGMILTNNALIAEKAKYLTTQAKDDDLRYIHNNVGYNYRLTNIQAALGVAQLENLANFVAIKKTNFNKYKELINKISGLKLCETPSYADNNHWFYSLEIEKSKYGISKNELIRILNENSIQARPLWKLNHLQIPYHDCFCYKIEKATRLYESTVNLPCSTNLNSSDIEFIIGVLKND